MITEDYVSFETAKLLKEKGFNRYPLFPCYKEDNGEFIDIPTTLDTINYCFIPAPTLQMAMKWLREEHNLFIEITVGDYDGRKIWYDFDVINIGKKDMPIVLPIDDIVELETYEQACEVAIKYCLENLI